MGKEEKEKQQQGTLNYCARGETHTARLPQDKMRNMAAVIIQEITLDDCHINKRKMVMDGASAKVLHGAFNRRKSMKLTPNPTFAVVLEKTQTYLPKDKTVECNPHGPQVQRLSGCTGSVKLIHTYSRFQKNIIQIY